MLIYKQVILSSPFILTCALTNTSGCFISSHLKNKLKKVKQDHVLSALLIFKSCYSQGEIICSCWILESHRNIELYYSPV